ncbi:MAG: winged helix-turn-helix transcriptional regulator [Proteobacteria bacterium]|nr:winged helix-turn-helix transcriptional regulator [Pseudomonadota bacterium]
MASGTSASSSLESAQRAIPRPAAIYDPVARALDAIGDRWVLVIVRHLLLGPKGFQELRHRTGIAPRVLSTRLRELIAQGFVAQREQGGYVVTERGRTLEPIVAGIARWYTRSGMGALNVDASRFTETSPQSILESLPFLLREERAAGADVTFEIRLTGRGGGVWTVRIADGTCTVVNDFADRADVRYTADAKTWCAMALGVADARDLVRRGRVTKDGGPAAMDEYFHQISRGVQDESDSSDRDRDGEGEAQ